MNISCCYVHKGKLYNLATMFGIWEKRKISLNLPVTILNSPDFELIVKKEDKNNIYRQEMATGFANNKTYFWMRNVLQHINKKPQNPTFHNAMGILNSYKNTALRNSTPYEKLLGCYCIKCSPETYDKVFGFFSSYNWSKNIGQYISGRSTRDWEPSSRIQITKQFVYAAYNDDPVFNPYMDSVADAEQVIMQETSAIKRQNIVNKYTRGGYKKLKFRKKGNNTKKKRP